MVHAKVVDVVDGQTLCVAMRPPHSPLNMIRTFRVRIRGIQCPSRHHAVADGEMDEDVPAQVKRPNAPATQATVQRQAAEIARHQVIQWILGSPKGAALAPLTGRLSKAQVHDILHKNSNRLVTIQCMGQDRTGRIVGDVWSADGKCMACGLLQLQMAIPARTELEDSEVGGHAPLPVDMMQRVVTYAQDKAIDQEKRKRSVIRKTLKGAKCMLGLVVPLHRHKKPHMCPHLHASDGAVLMQHAPEASVHSQ